MTAKQPQAGEYWQKEYTRVCVVGTKKNGLTVGETECGNLISFMSIHDWQHLPECDSFKWQPEEFCSMCGVNPVIPGTAGCNDCTEFALDAVRAPVESPDDWVEITDPNHEPRDGVDWFNGGPSGQWIIHEPRHVRSTLKEYQQSWPMGRFRCRRKDLPPVPSPKPVTVRLWRSPGLLSVVAADDPPTIHWQEIKHDGYKFYVEGQR